MSSRYPHRVLLCLITTLTVQCNDGGQAADSGAGPTDARAVEGTARDQGPGVDQAPAPDSKPAPDMPAPDMPVPDMAQPDVKPPPDMALVDTAPPDLTPAPLKLVQAFPLLSFVLPLAIVDAGDGSKRLFVVEQKGRILVFPNDPKASKAKVFLDIKSKVDSQGWEEGLLGLAFHPQYKTNGLFYVNYTASKPERTVIARYRVSAGDKDLADPKSEKVLLWFSQPYENHNGGHLAFGPKGYLYIAVGDGGAGGDPQNNGQNRKTLLGSMLRIDVDTTSGSKPYGIPKDNPFAGNSLGYREEIYAWGLRNPWRFSFDRKTGQLWAGDVGQNAWEEIDVIEKGKNYGWRVMEGDHCFNPPTGCSKSGLQPPVWDYTMKGGQSVTGGHVYRGKLLPQLVGQYIYADFITGQTLPVNGSP